MLRLSVYNHVCCYQMSPILVKSYLQKPGYEYHGSGRSLKQEQNKKWSAGSRQPPKTKESPVRIFLCLSRSEYSLNTLETCIFDNNRHMLTLQYELLRQIKALLRKLQPVQHQQKAQAVRGRGVHSVATSTRFPIPLQSESHQASRRSRVALSLPAPPPGRPARNRADAGSIRTGGHSPILTPSHPNCRTVNQP